MSELLLSADEKELRDLHKSVDTGNHLICRVKNHSPDYKTKTWTYYFHITASDGKVYYWPETFKDYQAARVFADIKSEFGTSVSIDHSGNEDLKSFFEPASSNVISLNFSTPS